MLFIGGKNDGKRINISFRVPYHQLLVLEKTPVVRWEDADIPEARSMKVEVYTRHDIHVGDMILYVMAIEGMSDGQVISALINGYKHH